MLNSFSKFFPVLLILAGSIFSVFADNQPLLRVMSFNLRTSKNWARAISGCRNIPKKLAAGRGTRLPRICTWARLRDRTTGHEFLYANTHFDHKGHLAREKSAQLILTRLTDLAKGVPIILTGDFNVTEDSKPYAVIAGPNANSSVSLIDSYREVHRLRKPDEASFNGFKPVVNGSRIDFIFHSAQLKATA